MSQFIEMFGIAEATKPLADFIEVSFPGEWGQEDKDGSGVKVIRTTNFTNNGKLDLSEVVTRDIDSAKIEKKKLFKGDIILERSGGTNDNPVGRVVYFEEDGVYLFNNFTQLLRCKEGVNSLFIFYSLFNYYQMNKNVIRSMGNKTTGIQNLKMDRYWQIPITDVSIELQKEFESIYRQADKSGFDGRKSQFIEMFGNNVSKKKISDVCDVRGGSTPTRTTKEFWNNGTISWFTVEDIYEQGRYITETKQHITKLATKKCFIYPVDTVLICCTASVGEYAITKKEMASNQQFNGMMIKDKSELHPEYLLYVASTLKEDLLRQAGKTTINFVSRSKLENIEIPVPPYSEQLGFVSVYRQADKSGSVLQHMIAC